MSDLSIYNRKDIYEAEIKPHIDALMDICCRSQIPFMVSVAVENTATETEYIHEGLPAGGIGMKLTNDLFAKYLLAIRGGQFVLPSQINFDANQEYIESRFEEEKKISVDSSESVDNKACDGAYDGDLNFL